MGDAGGWYMGGTWLGTWLEEAVTPNIEAMGVPFWTVNKKTSTPSVFEAEQKGRKR